MNKKKITTQFPSIYRFIPESKFIKKIIKSKHTKNFMFGLYASVVIVLIVLVLIVYFGLFRNINTFINIENQRQIIKKQINFWQSITDKYEGYKDAYFQIALLEYRLGEFKNSKKANNKSLMLDPNYENAKKLELLLNTKD